jgi:hypothetical protein
MTSIRLHPELGVNPRLFTEHCPLCGKADEQVLLLGQRNFKDTCAECGMVHIGGSDRDKYGVRACKRCGGGVSTREILRDSERFDGKAVCDECRAHMLQGIIIVSLGAQPEGQQSAGPEGRPITGYFVVREEAFRRLFVENSPLAGNDEKLKAALERRAIYMDEEVCRLLGLFELVPTEAPKAEQQGDSEQ